MRRGNDDEKTVAPMFPRLHVNDKEKGGPRAPPRNKMALYEQFSIPSQRVNTSVNHPGSSNQGYRHERSMFFAHQPPTSTNPTEKLKTGFSDLNTSGTQLVQKKKQAEEDFTVPIFVNSAKNHSTTSIGVDRDKRSSLISAYSGHTTNKVLKESNNYKSSHDKGGRSEQNPKEDVALGEPPVKQDKSPLVRERIKDPLNASAGHERRDWLVNSSERLENSGAGHGSEDSFCSAIPGKDSSPDEQRKPDDPTLDRARDEDETHESLHVGIGDRGDDASETSMVDSVSGFDISPDDVVGIIGQNHFWKARKAMSNQQRVFAVQVFELHRLIKVQKLIAESPNILLEDTAYLGKESKGSLKEDAFLGKEVKDSLKRKLQLEYILGQSPPISEKKADDSENPNDKKECSAENAIGMNSPSVGQNSGHPFSGNPNLPADPRMNPWCYPQPTGHQWLVPVMSPTEGLVYKPYGGHGFMGPESNMMQNFINPRYGVPGPFPQGAGFPPASPQVSHGFFPPYGMQVSNSVVSSSAVEQATRFGGLGRPGRAPDDGGNNSNKGIQSSRNMPTPRATARDNTAPKESDMQGSTASSPGEKGQRNGASRCYGPEEWSTLSLFPASPTVNATVEAGGDRSPRVIRVVPHNARSATESVARIFQSIQEERKQLEPV